MKHSILLFLSVAMLGDGAAHATAFASGAAAASGSIVAGGVTLASTMLAPVSGTAGTAYAKSGGVASANEKATLVAPSLLTGGVGAYQTLTTGIVTTQATGGATSATATTTLNTVAAGLSTQLGAITLASLGINAKSIISTSTVGIGANGLYGTGSATLTGLGFSGDLLGALNIGAGALANPLANTVLFSIPTLTITLNEQLQNASAGGLSFSTNAIHVALNDYVFNGQALRGDIILGHSEASVSGYQPAAVPEPASRAMCVAGFGVIGSTLRRRKRTAAIA